MERELNYLTYKKDGHCFPFYLKANGSWDTRRGCSESPLEPFWWFVVSWLPLVHTGLCRGNMWAISH